METTSGLENSCTDFYILFARVLYLFVRSCVLNMAPVFGRVCHWILLSVIMTEKESILHEV